MINTSMHIPIIYLLSVLVQTSQHSLWSRTVLVKWNQSNVVATADDRMNHSVDSIEHQLLHCLGY